MNGLKSYAIMLYEIKDVIINLFHFINFYKKILLLMIYLKCVFYFEKLKTKKSILKNKEEK